MLAATAAHAAQTTAATTVTDTPAQPALKQPPKALFPKFGDTLQDHGINIGIVYTDLFLRNLATGLDRWKSANYGAVGYDVTLDLDKIAGIPDTKLNLIITQNLLQENSSSYTFKVNNAFFPGIVTVTPTALNKLSVETGFFDRKLDVEIGRMSPTTNFFLPSYCGFCYASTPAITLDQPGITAAGVWGGRAEFDLDSQNKFQAELAENDGYVFQHTDGWYFSTRHANGYIGIASWQHKETFQNSAYPANWEIGAYRDSAEYDDPIYNVDGTSKIFNPAGKVLVHRDGTNGVYAQFRKVVWTGGARSFMGPETLALYGGTFITPGAGQSYPVEAYGGAEITGFVPQSPLLMAGVGLQYIRLGDRRALYEQQIRMALGGAKVKTAQDMFAPNVHMRIPLTPFALLQPFAVYFINPNNAIIPSRTEQKNGWFLGINLLVNIGGALGIDHSAPPM
jgi:porin